MRKIAEQKLVMVLLRLPVKDSAFEENAKIYLLCGLRGLNLSSAALDTPANM